MESLIVRRGRQTYLLEYALRSRSFHFSFYNRQSRDSQALLWKEGFVMTWKQIEASREARLWLTQIVLPVATVVMLVPEARNAVAKKAKEAKTYVKNKFVKN